MSIDMFLKIDGVEGESNDSKHKEEIEILSFSWGISDANKSNVQMPGHLSMARKVSVQDFSIVKQLDKSSPILFQKCCEGEHIASATLTLRKSGETPVDYYKIKLTDVIISSVTPGGAVGGNTSAMEQVSFSFRSVDIAAADQEGRFGPSVNCGGSMLEETIGRR